MFGSAEARPRPRLPPFAGAYGASAFAWKEHYRESGSTARKQMRHRLSVAVGMAMATASRERGSARRANPRQPGPQPGARDRRPLLLAIPASSLDARRLVRNWTPIGPRLGRTLPTQIFGEWDDDCRPFSMRLTLDVNDDALPPTGQDVRLRSERGHVTVRRPLISREPMCSE